MAKSKRQAPRQSRAKTPPPVKKYDSEARIPSQSHTDTPYKRSSALNVKVEKTTPNLEKVKRIDILIQCDMGEKIFHNVPELIEIKFSDAILKDGLITLRAQITGETALKLMDAIPEPGNAGPDVSVLRGSYCNGTHRWPGLTLNADEKQESMLSTFFDAIVGHVCTKFNIPKESVRVFSDDHADTPLGDNNGRCLRKPDIAVLDADVEEDDVDWERVRGCVELKINNKTRAQALRQIRQYARMIFKNQPGRRFVLSATLLDDKMMFIVHDRVGELASEEFNIHDYPEKLVRIVVGFAFCTEKNLGYDPSYYKRCGATFIKLDGQEYQVVRDIYVDPSICGRGTLVRELCPVRDSRAPVVAGHTLIGRKGNCVLKDVWVDKSRKGKEWDFLEDLEKKNFEGVVRMKFHEEVKIDGKLDTTGTDRAVFQELVDEDYVDKHGNKRTRKVERWRTRKEWELFENLEEREHHFLVLKTLGQPLESFRSKKELVSAFRDIFDTLRRLEEDHKLHGDLSLNNVVLVDVDDMDDKTPVDGQSSAPVVDKATLGGDGKSKSWADNHAASSGGVETSPRLRKGVIIDFDYAVDKEKEEEAAKKAKEAEEAEKGEGAKEDDGGEVYYQSRGFRTGTLPFMAVDILSQNPPGSNDPPSEDVYGDPIIHEYYHDLESVFYMLCWLCIAQAGPNSKDRQSTEPFVYKTSAIGQWAAAGQDEPNYGKISLEKNSMVITTNKFKREVLEDFHQHFEILKTYVERLREVICPLGALIPAQEENIRLNKSPDLIRKICKMRPKAEVFKWIDQILGEAQEDPKLDDDEDGERPVASSSKVGKNRVVKPSRVQRLSRRRRGELDETFVEGENNEDPVVGPEQSTGEKPPTGGEAMDEGNSPDENERAPSPTNNIKAVQARASMPGSTTNSARVDSGYQSANRLSSATRPSSPTKRSLNYEENEELLATTSETKKPRKLV